MLELREQPGGFSFRVRVIPKAHKNSLAGIEDGVLVVRLSAPPVEGKANVALVDYLATVLGLRKRQVWLESGQKSRHKLVRVEGLRRDELAPLIHAESEE